MQLSLMLTVEQLSYVIMAQYFGILLPGAGSRWKSSVGGAGPLPRSVGVDLPVAATSPNTVSALPPHRA